ncbi:MAG: Beta-ketoacyl-[acyl-carrier-protein] synthase, partial [Cyanobacteria bacterium RYN_339]|nr:Beta-ketoacyl-[acyl-carrier-protein] synthase [Cyanobacteria bacterium RYN_339]
GLEADGLIHGFDPKGHLGPKGLRSLDRPTTLALTAAGQALAQANLPPEGVGVVLGSAFSGLDSIMGFFEERLAEGANFVTASNFSNIVMNAAASQVALRHGLTRLNSTISTGQASGLDAIGYGLEMLVAGRADALLVGGLDELGRGSRAVMAARGAHFRAAEGAAFLVLERPGRDAVPLARVLGYGAAFDPGPVRGRAPDPRAIERAMRLALGELRGVDAVLASANGQADLDGAEATAIATVLGADTPVQSPKRLMGDALGAGGALAAIQAVTMAGTVLVNAVSETGHCASVVIGRAR